MEIKGLRVNARKTKVRPGQVENTGKYPCSLCKEGVGSLCGMCSADLYSLLRIQCTNSHKIFFNV